MIAIIGLGNPGNKYKRTKHNLGFIIVEKFAKENNFPEFKLSKKGNMLVSEDNFNQKKVFLIKPQTFMNNSGKAVKALKTNDIIVVHDDIDLSLGKIKISKKKGSAGHKGVDSVIKELKTNDFWRIRIGIKPKEKPENVEKFVLQKFEKETATNKAVKAIGHFLTFGPEKTMSNLNKLTEEE